MQNMLILAPSHEGIQIICIIRWSWLLQLDWQNYLFMLYHAARLELYTLIITLLIFWVRQKGFR